MRRLRGTAAQVEAALLRQRVSVSVETSPDAALMVTTCECGKVVSAQEIDPGYGPILTDRGRCRSCFKRDQREALEHERSEAAS